MHSSSHGDHKIEPEYLGPLTDRPLAETARSTSPDDLFPGASTYLRGRQQRRRAEQWKAVKPLVERLLRPEEHVLYVAHAMQVPPVLQYMALGAMALSFHQVILVFTDTRLIEVLLGVRGKRPETRVRSFPWASVRDLKPRLGKLNLVAERGKNQSWRIPLRGDAKIVKLLVARLKRSLLQQGAAMAQTLPLWHCPQCAATVAPNPKSCDACKTSFRSTRQAALLSLAFPGAGLLYAGHPLLAALDLFGEVVLYLAFLLMTLEAEPGGLKIALGIGFLLFALTKLHSVHLSQILVSRSKPETEQSRTRYQRFALIGGLASLLLIGGALPLAGAARAVVDRDLDFKVDDSAWHGSRNAQEWNAFADDPAARSQWQHSDGARVTLFAYPQHMLDSVSEFRDGVRQALHERGMKIVMDDEEVPAPFQGFRFITVGETQEGEPVSTAQYFILDQQNRDIHQAVAAVLDEDGSSAAELICDLLSHARWVERIPAERIAGSTVTSSR